jgi:glutamate racemase
MIGIFDSGIGGLTTVRAIMNVLPGYDIVYFGDTARTPYGSKSRETVINYALQDTEFLLQKGANIIVAACNTASSVATETLKTHFGLPIFEVISPAVSKAMESSRHQRIGIIATRATIRSGIYEQKIREQNPAARVYSAATPLLVPLVEEGWIKKPETRMIIKKYLIPLKTRQIDTLILGCTHYPLLESIIQQKIGKRVKVINSSTVVAENLKHYLQQHPEVDEGLQKNGHAAYFVSDITDQFEQTARSIIKRRISLQHVEI